jgi:acetoacetate decarboxylase
MLYNLSKGQLDKVMKATTLSEFTNAEILLASFKTNPEVIREILPKPLKPSPDSSGTVFVARYPQTNFGSVYNEGALFLNCEFKGERGGYCLSMPVDEDMAMIGGREIYGYPKKMAEKISLERNGDHVIGSVIRKGTELIRMECQLEKEAPGDILGNLASVTEDWEGVKCYKFISFLFKHFLSPGSDSFDYFPRLVREAILFRPTGNLKIGTGNVTLRSSACDPLGEIPVESVSIMMHGFFHNSMLPGKVVGRVWNPFRFLKHAFFKIDYIPELLENFDPNQIEQVRTIIKQAKKN